MNMHIFIFFELKNEVINCIKLPKKIQPNLVGVKLSNFVLKLRVIWWYLVICIFASFILNNYWAQWVHYVIKDVG